MAKQKETTKKEEKIVARVLTHGRFFEGTVIKKFPHRVVLTFQRTVFIPKFESYAKKITKLHARLPEGMNVEIGDYIKVQECRPLSKIIHFIVVEKIRSAPVGAEQ